jgi:multiple sugar transport system permease protein
MTAATHTATTGATAVAKPRRRWRRFDLRTVGRTLGMVLIVLWCLAPFYWMLVTSLRHVDFTYDSTPYPKHVTFENYRAVFQGGNHFGRALLNTVFIGAVTTLIAMIVGVTCAYAIARLHFRGKFAVLGLILAASMFPGVAVVTPLFQFFTNIHWLGTYQALIVPDLSFALPLCVYVLSSFFTQMPWELEQAAKVDGASPDKHSAWSSCPWPPPDYSPQPSSYSYPYGTNTYSPANSPTATPAPVTYAIATFSGSDPRIVPYTSIMAAGVLVTVPLVIVVLLFQRRIVSGLTAGGVKG